ncbi:MAG: hypothetical protein ACP5LG_02150 [Conexivisphaera sp.]
MACEALTTGSRALDDLLGLSAPSLTVVHGARGAGKSAVLRAAAVSYAAGCGRAALASVGFPLSPADLGRAPGDALDRLVLIRIADEGSIVAASRAFALIDFGLVALDDASDLREASRRAAPLSYLALSISRAVSSRGLRALVALRDGPTGTRGLAYWWPFADRLVALEVLGGGMHRARSARGEALFRLVDGSIREPR